MVDKKQNLLHTYSDSWRQTKKNIYVKNMQREAAKKFYSTCEKE